MKKFLIYLFLLSCVCIYANSEYILYSTDAKNSLNRDVRIIEKMKLDGTNREAVISPDFIGERFWPGFRGVGPTTFETPSVSSCGRMILFGNTHDIYVTNWENNIVIQLTRFTREKYRPSFSPNGKKIIFSSDLSENCEIYTMNYDGSNLKRITWSRANNISPCYSPNGENIAFTSDVNGKFELFITDKNGFQTNKILSLENDIREVAWGSNNLIAFTTSDEKGNFSIMTISLDNLKVETLLTSSQFLGHVAWNKDCTLLAFSSIEAGNSDIWLLNTNTKKKQNISNTNNKNEYFPCFIPKQLTNNQLKYNLDIETLNNNKLSEEGRKGKIITKSYPVKMDYKKLSRPRMLFTASELPTIRQKFTKEPYKSAWEKFLKKCNYYTNENGKKKIELSLATIPNESLRKQYTISAFADMYNRALWLDALYSLSFAYQVTKNELYGKYATSILLKSADLYRYNHGFMQSDYRVACAYDWIYDLIPQKEKLPLTRLLNGSMQKKKDTCLNHSVGILGVNAGNSNYSIYFSASLGPIALALLGEDDINSESLDIAERLAFITLNRWIGENGDASEGFSYFKHPMDTIMPFLISLKKYNGAKDILNSNLSKVPFWFAMSSSKNGKETPAIGDADYLYSPIPIGMLELYNSSSKLKDIWNKVPRQNKLLTVEDLLFWQEKFDKKIAKNQNLKNYATFKEAGYAVLRADDFNGNPVMTVSAPSQSGHAHREYGAILLTAFNLRFIADPGQSIQEANTHSQIIINGKGRERNSVKNSLFSNFLDNKFYFGINVNYAKTFSFGILGHDKTGIPYGTTPLKSAERNVTMVYDKNHKVPPYFLIYDALQVKNNSRIEQQFISDQGMKITKVNNNEFQIREDVNENIKHSNNNKNIASWDVNFETDGEYYIHIYAKNSKPLNIGINSQKYSLIYHQTPSRLDTWQWRVCNFKGKPLKLKLKKGKHKITLQTTAKVQAIAFAKNISVTKETAKIKLKLKDAILNGNWKDIAPEKAFLRIISLMNSPKREINKLAFKTRFHGQLLVELPKCSFVENGNNAKFLTFIYPTTPEMQQPKFEKNKIIWEDTIDSIEIKENIIYITRKIKEK